LTKPSSQYCAMTGSEKYLLVWLCDVTGVSLRPDRRGARLYAGL
jgi:hypothetical protein